jgi:hypothetical protein
MTTKRMLVLFGLAGLALLAVLLYRNGDDGMKIGQIVDSALSIVGIRSAEEPPYEVVEQTGDLEIRRYGPRVAAETTVAIGKGKPSEQAFFILAKYIFGGNREKRDIAMTAPVTMDEGRQIAMTAPVTMTSPSTDSMTMRFFLPAKIALNDAPAPNDPRVKLLEVPAETLAVVQFTGSWSERAVKEKQAALLAELQKTTWRPVGEPFTQLYDPPFTIPFLRRNEVAVRVAPAS